MSQSTSLAYKRQSNFSEVCVFFRAVLRRPILTGAIVPSSPQLAYAMTANIGLEQARTVVEIGAGTGAFTGPIATLAPQGALVMTLEIDPRLCRFLICRYPRVRVITDSAVNLSRHMQGQGQAPADCIISGLPWVVFSFELQRVLLQSIVGNLHPEGCFTTFAYSHTAWLPSARRFRRLLGSHFQDVQASRVVWRNLPPAFVYRCRKPVAVEEPNGSICMPQKVH